MNRLLHSWLLGWIIGSLAGLAPLCAEEQRYIRYSTGEEELYHIATDPHEWHNLVKNPPYKHKLIELQQNLAATLQSLSE